MVGVDLNQKISEIRELPKLTSFLTEPDFFDPGVLDPKTLFMLSETVTGFHNKKRDMSSWYIYHKICRLVLDRLTTKLPVYSVSGAFNFATHGVRLYCTNPEPSGRYVINYKQCQNWFNGKKDDSGSGFSDMLDAITYKDHTNPAYNPPEPGS